MTATNVQTSTQPVEMRRNRGIVDGVGPQLGHDGDRDPRHQDFARGGSSAQGLAEGADHVLRYEAAAPPGFFPNLTGAIAIAQSLAAVTFSLGGSAARKRLQNTEAHLAATSQYVAEKG